MTIRDRITRLEELLRVARTICGDLQVLLDLDAEIQALKADLEEAGVE